MSDSTLVLQRVMRLSNPMAMTLWSRLESAHRGIWPMCENVRTGSQRWLRPFSLSPLPPRCHSLALPSLPQVTIPRVEPKPMKVTLLTSPSCAPLILVFNSKLIWPVWNRKLERIIKFPEQYFVVSVE